MYRWHRIARAKTDKFPEAVQWAKEVSSYVNTKYPPSSIQAYAEVFGEVNLVHWYADYEDLAQLERINSQLLADKAYWGMINKAAALFIDGSAHDTLINSL